MIGQYFLFICMSLAVWLCLKKCSENRVLVVLLQIGTSHKRNAALIWVFSKPALTPPPGILELLGHFSVGYFFSKLLGHFFVIFHQTSWGKSAQKLLDLVNSPPPFPFSKHRPSGPMLSISRFVRPSVRLSVCLCVCSLLRYRLNVF